MRLSCSDGEAVDTAVRTPGYNRALTDDPDASIDDRGGVAISLLLAPANIDIARAVDVRHETRLTDGARILASRKRD